MKTTRRTLMGSTAAVLAAPSIGRAQARPPRNRTVSTVMHGDVPTFDPIWTTANMSAYHGAMVYDTLFGLDEKYVAQPQMVGRHNLSDDKLTWTFELRDGLKWTDGTDVTAKDCVASIRRWAARDGAGQHMMERVRELTNRGDKTIVLTLREQYGLVLDALAKTSTPLCFMMREREALTDPMQKIERTVGSGPFIMNEGETRPGSQYVYDRNPNYVPRAEPASAIAGGKKVLIDRAVFQNMPDIQTAVAALQAGEVDFVEQPPIDTIAALESDPDIKTAIVAPLGNVGWIRLNFLYPPFNNAKARQAVLWSVNQADHMKATFVEERYYRTCGSLFTCGTPMENDANTEWFKKGPSVERAKALLRESGYNGEPVTLLQATNILYMSNAAQILAQELRAIGMNIQMIPMDWSGVVQRRAVKAPPAQGGWNIFITSADGLSVSNPIWLAGHAATGERGWFGWPTDERHEQLRDAWVKAPDLEHRQTIAREMQDNAWNFVPHAYFGQWSAPVAYRANVTGWPITAGVRPLWNVTKT
ncbi:MAG: ABC transporter substrate-binding protein [Acetobacteraceae bacterium]|nr:ABC transporter substrate-binding protein [Acetobacteraceae bacterium]